MNIMQKQPLLLTQTRNLLVKVLDDSFIIEEFPEWLAQLLGQNPESFAGKHIEETIEATIPGLKELLRRTMESRSPVKGFKTGFVDKNNLKHQLILDTSLKKFSEKSPIISVLIQEIPLEFIHYTSLEEATFCGLIGVSDAMQNVFNKVRMYAVSDAPVLITGETGAGKEGIAQALHQLSKRANKPYITLNCSAITETLFESELFGHEKGSFTGAIKTHRGKFERANGGTLFLDEIGDLPLSSQAKLLRVLETSQIEKVGAESTIIVDVRIIAATNHDLEKISHEKSFRLDLFYRISALQIKIPPLRERIEDIEPLIRHFIRVLNKKYNRNVVCLTREAIQLLKQYRWPGNVRELRNLMERLFAENQTEVIGLRALKEWYQERQMFLHRTEISEDRSYKDITILPYRNAIPLGMNKIENERIIPAEYSKVLPTENNGRASIKPLTKEDLKAAYSAAGGNITRASEILGIHKATFYRHLKNFDLTREDLEK
ncbi:MAG: hypothetical protein Kow0029_20130 [Candidatus Rifleibacteriota bacterium]